MPTKITYNGKTTEVSAGDIATITCKDYKMATDVVVEAPESEGEIAKLYSIEVTPTKAIQNVLPEGDYDGFDEVIVNPIPDEYVIPNLQEKTATENGDVTADEGYTGLSKVTVNVPSEEPNLISKTFTENGTYKASEEGADSIVGTWKFNDTLTADGLRAYNNNSVSGIKYNFTFWNEDRTIKAVKLDYNTLYSRSAIGFVRSDGSGSNMYYFYDADGNTDYWGSDNWKIIHITTDIQVGLNNVTEEIAEAFRNWLKANATKVSIDGYSEVIVNVASEEVEEWDGSGVVIEEIATEDTEDELSGTWHLNESLSGGPFTYNFDFESNGETYNKLYADGDLTTGNTLYYQNDNGDEAMVYTEEMYGGSTYRNLNILSNLADVTDGEALLTWLKANASKQGATSLISFTIDGTSYQAEEGMTWGEWVESDYNTNGYTKNSDNLIISSGGAAVVNSSYETVQASYEIISGSAYKLSQGGGA